MNQQVANSIEIRASRLSNQQYATYPDKNKRYPRPDRSIDKEFKFNPVTDRVGPHFSETLSPPPPPLFRSFVARAYPPSFNSSKEQLFPFFFFFIIFPAVTQINLKTNLSTRVPVPRTSDAHIRYL